jgi:coenzyme F420 hydrogenase subunit beta
MDADAFVRLKKEIVETGLCTHCGTCAGLSNGTLVMRRTDRGPLPIKSDESAQFRSEAAVLACPGYGVDYPSLWQWLYNRQPDNFLLGCFQKVFLGYSKNTAIRRGASSGGVITHVLIYLLEKKLIDGAVVLRHGHPEPWLSSPAIVKTKHELIAASQSVYVPSPVNTILGEMQAFDGKLAYVGLPDQVASLRRLQQLGHPATRNVKYVLGPYVGTSMYLGAIESFLRSNGVRSLEEIFELRYREGEWPGYLQIKTRSGKVIRSEKFYYNYLIPFYLTTSALLSVDFTNELTDLSVGDAWRPDLEAQGEGFSVVIARTPEGQALLEAMQEEGFLHVEEIGAEETLTMHGHMIEFKKRGSFIRIGMRRYFGLAVPSFGYQPNRIPFTRRLIESFIVLSLLLGRTRLARRLVELIPIQILGPLFNALRQAWKSISKPTKRKGLAEVPFKLDAEMADDQAR